MMLSRTMFKTRSLVKPNNLVRRGKSTLEEVDTTPYSTSVQVSNLISFDSIFSFYLHFIQFTNSNNSFFNFT